MGLFGKKKKKAPVAPVETPAQIEARVLAAAAASEAAKRAARKDAREAAAYTAIVNKGEQARLRQKRIENLEVSIRREMALALKAKNERKEGLMRTHILRKVKLEGQLKRAVEKSEVLGQHQDALENAIDDANFVDENAGFADDMAKVTVTAEEADETIAEAREAMDSAVDTQLVLTQDHAAHAELLDMDAEMAALDAYAAEEAVPTDPSAASELHKIPNVPSNRPAQPATFAPGEIDLDAEMRKMEESIAMT